MSYLPTHEVEIPLVSICIPTYNRSESVCRLVRSILAHKALDIEVIVVNNASPDNTHEALSEISDARFRFYSNDNNRGALYNMLRALSLGRGRYVIYSTDQDYFFPEKLSELMQILVESSQISCGYCLFPGDHDSPTQLFSRGIDAMMVVAYRSRHPTGYFFRNSDLRSIGYPDKFNQPEDVELFPLEFVFAELAVLGDALVYAKGLFKPEESNSVAEHKSSTTDGRSKSAFFAPASRLRMAKKFVKHLDTLPIRKIDAIRVEANVLLSSLSAATLGYRSIMLNEKLCAHYRMAVERMPTMYLMRIGVYFVLDFFSTRKSNRVERIVYAITVISVAGYRLMLNVFSKAVSLIR